MYQALHFQTASFDVRHLPRRSAVDESGATARGLIPLREGGVRRDTRTGPVGRPTQQNRDYQTPRRSGTGGVNRIGSRRAAAVGCRSSGLCQRPWWSFRIGVVIARGSPRYSSWVPA